jgi:class 3 adenylate cyclase
MGTIPPAETSRFVGTVLELAVEGKDRLVNETVRRGNAGTLELEEARFVLPNTHIADDHSVELARQNVFSRPRTRYPKTLPLYSHAELDPDGHLRRVVPFDADDGQDYEHIAYHALKNRFGYTAVASNAAGQFLVMEKVPGLASAGDRFFALDKNGAIIVKRLQKEQKFRTIDLVDFIEYEKLDRDIYKILSESTDIGPYGGVSAEKYPSYLWEREREARKELLESADAALKPRWIDARNEYLNALDTFFYASPVENTLNATFDSLLQDERLSDAGRERLITMRDELLGAFWSGRGAYNQFSEIRARLVREVPGSFGILGAASVDTLASALLADTIITGSMIAPASTRYIFFWSICAAFFCVFIVRVCSPLATLIAGTLLSAAVLAGFSYSFIAGSVWIDPFIPLCGTAGGIFVSMLCSIYLKRSLKQKFTISYGPFITKSYMGRLIRAGYPKPGDYLTARAAIVAVKNPALSALESGKPAAVSSAAITKFRNEVKSLFLKTGAVIAGANGDTVLAAFGSPVERVALNFLKDEMAYDDETTSRSAHHPVKKAAGFISDLIGISQEAANWCFGMDYGECTFIWTALSGYTVFGPPAYNARLLAASAYRHRAGVLVSKNCTDNISEALMRKHTAPLPDDDTARDAVEFYELLAKKIKPTSSRAVL